jgi:hypothetical protein
VPAYSSAEITAMIGEWTVRSFATELGAAHHNIFPDKPIDSGITDDLLLRPHAERQLSVGFKLVFGPMD